MTANLRLAQDLLTCGTKDLCAPAALERFGVLVLLVLEDLISFSR